MKTSLLLLALCAFVAFRLSAQGQFKFNYDDPGPSHLTGGEDILYMIGEIRAKDISGQPYHEQDIPSLVVNNLDLGSGDVAELAKIKSLEYLRLGFGPEGITLKTDDLSPLAALKKLEHLDLHVINLEGKHLEFLRKLEGLKSLDISRHYTNRWKFDEPSAALIAGMKNLEELRLSYKGIDDNMVKTLGASGRLKVLRISTDAITDAAAERILKNDGLTELYLSSPLLTDRVADRLPELKHITDLTLYSNKLTPGILTQLKEMPNLKRLELSIDKSTPEMFAALRGMTNLETLRIDSCPATSADLALLKGHPNLEAIFLPAAVMMREEMAMIYTLPKIKHSNIGKW